MAAKFSRLLTRAVQQHCCMQKRCTVTAPVMDLQELPVDLHFVDCDVTCDRKSLNDMPGPVCYPVIGSVHEYLPGGKYYKIPTPEVDKKRRKEFGNIYKEVIPFMGKALVHVYDPDDVKVIFHSEGKYPIRDAFHTNKFYNAKYNNNVNGLLTAHREEWKRLRECVQKKMMRPKSVSSYIPEQSKVSDDLVEKIRLGLDKNNQIQDIKDDIVAYSAECIGVVCFNCRLGTLKNISDKSSEAQKFIRHVKHIMLVSHKEWHELPLYRLFNTKSFQKLKQAREFIRGLAIKYSQSSMERFQSAPSNTREEGDLVPYLLSKTELSQREVLSVIEEFITAGVDATSAHISYMLYLLGKHPRMQEKLFDEIHKEIGDDNVTCDNLSNMSYLKAVSKETNRLLPATSGTIRNTDKELSLSGYRVPPGVTVAVHWSVMTRDPANFKDPDSFIPERWLRQSREDIHPFAFTPFGFGARSCVGRRFAEQQSFLAIIKILQRYAIRYTGGRLKTETGSSIAPVSELSFEFIPRKVTRKTSHSQGSSKIQT